MLDKWLLWLLSVPNYGQLVMLDKWLLW